MSAVRIFIRRGYIRQVDVRYRILYDIVNMRKNSRPLARRLV